MRIQRGSGGHPPHGQRRSRTSGPQTPPASPFLPQKSRFCHTCRDWAAVTSHTPNIPFPTSLLRRSPDKADRCVSAARSSSDGPCRRCDAAGGDAGDRPQPLVVQRHRRASWSARTRCLLPQDGLLPPPDHVENGKPSWYADTVRALGVVARPGNNRGRGGQSAAVSLRCQCAVHASHKLATTGFIDPPPRGGPRPGSGSSADAGTGPGGGMCARRVHRRQRRGAASPDLRSRGSRRRPRPFPAKPFPTP